MIALPAGNGAWAKTNIGYAPACALTLRLDRVGDNDSQKVIASFSSGAGGEWTAILGAQWREPFPPDMNPSTILEVVLIYSQNAVEVWRDESENGVYWGYYPDFIERAFWAQFTGLIATDRNTYAPTRGAYVQHFEEIAGERRWYADEDDVGAQATFGIYAKNYAAGTALPADAQSVGVALNPSYDWAAGTGSGRFNGIVLVGEDVPCGGLNENGGDAVGSGNNITCQNQDWSGSIYAPMSVLYHCPDAEVDGRVLSPVCRMATNGGIEPYNGVPVVDDLMTLRDSVASSPSDTLHGFDSGALWNLSWGASPAWASGFFADRKVGFSILPAWAAAAGAEEDEKDNDLAICQRGYPLNDQVKTSGRVAALTFAHLGAQEVEFPEGAGTRRSNWTAIAGSVGVNVTNNAASTVITVDPGGSGGAERTLVNRWVTREIQQLCPIDADEDFWNWSNYGALAWDVTATWAAAADRDFTLRVTCEDATGTPFSHNYLLRLTVGAKGTPITVLADLAFPDGAMAIPRLYRVVKLEWLGLVAGDDFTFTSMELLPEADNGQDSERLQLSFPDSKDGADRFGCAGLVCGGLTFDETDQGIGQGGAQRGIAHYYVSGLRILDEAAAPYGLADVLNYQQGWTATALDLGNALEDADANVLIGPVMMLLEEQFDTPAGTLYLSPRYASFTVPYGATYTARPHKILRGAIHGLAHYGIYSERAAAAESIEIVLCSGGVPTPMVTETATTDEWGHFVAGRLYEDLSYSVRYSGVCGSPVNAEKRWQKAFVPGVVEGQRCCMYTLADGRVGYCWIQGTDIRFAELAGDYATGGAQTIVDASGNYDSVWCTSDGHVIRVIGRLTSTQELYEWWTMDHWTSQNGPTLLT